jgi:hypothetical protein
MANGHADQIKKVEAEITALSDALAHLGKGEDFRELLKIIRFPGYTTPAEMLFTLGLVKLVKAQTKVLTETKAVLIDAAKQVATR